MRLSRQKGFTLVELLMVVAIVALLLSMLTPTLQRAKELTRRGICASNLRHIHVCTQVYADENRNLVPPRYWPWSQYHVGNDYTTGEAQLAMGFLLLTNGQYVQPDMLFCPSDRYFSLRTNWPEDTHGGTRTWLAYCCSYAQREERYSSSGAFGLQPERFRMPFAPANWAYAGDFFTTAIPAIPYAVHKEGWMVATFGGASVWVERTDEIWSGITWSTDYTGQGLTWRRFDR